MKYIRNIIITLLIIIIIVILILLSINSKQKETSEEDSYDNNADITNIDTNIKQVDNSSLYYTVYECLSNFYKTVTMDISETEEDYIEGGEISYSTLIGVSSEDDRNVAIYNQLNKKYISDNEITKNNVYNKIKFINNNFIIEKMYIIDEERIKEFYVYETNDETDEKILLNVTLDINNKTYSVRPMEVIEYNKINKENVENIEKNDNNRFEYANVSDEQMAKNYFNDYKNNIFKNISKMYGKLEEQYRKERFGSLENYKEYITKNQEELENITIKKYSINNYDEYIEYVCQDQYENLYIFRATAVMDYELLLDTYTITTDKFKETYNSADDEKKVQMNIDKFIQMINRHDYMTSYNCIAGNFKNNYFRTQEEFENYVKNQFFPYNKLTFKNYEQKGKGLYVFNIELSDLTGENEETRNVSIIMQLNNNLDFEMSFGM